MDSIEILKDLYVYNNSDINVQATQLPESGSSRVYYRLDSELGTAVGAYNEDVKENLAFFKYTDFFLNHNLNVPEVFRVTEDQKHYVMLDLGNKTLFRMLQKERQGDDLNEFLEKLYKEAIEQLVNFQIIGRDIDFSVAYPCPKFDKQAMLFDLNYFKYYFLRLSGLQYNEFLLDNDFNRLADFLLETDCTYFMYRDFQSRNIMVSQNKIYFIDYQGGRQGALQYDIASLLYDAKANLSPADRQNLLDYYISQLSLQINVDKENFLKYYYGYVLIRILQSMGAYGLRGFYEQKQHFLQSIPYAQQNLKDLLSKNILNSMPELTRVLNEITGEEMLKRFSPKERLKVTVNSFSYRSGIPKDENGNGGGFIFDCRALNNPGRYEQYKSKTGKDNDVIAFLSAEEDVKIFIDNAYTMIDLSIKKYMQRKFTHLQVSFGCTGGRHRSVYCAELLGEMLKFNSEIEVEVKHFGISG